VRALQRVRFLGPPAEPDVRVPTHPALHETVPLCYPADGLASWGHGAGMVVPR
jgi:hypothetical protein